MVLLTLPSLQQSECEFVEVVLNEDNDYEEGSTHHENEEYDGNYDSGELFHGMYSEESPRDVKSLFNDTIITNDTRQQDCYSNEYNEDKANDTSYCGSGGILIGEGDVDDGNRMTSDNMCEQFHMDGNGDNNVVSLLWHDLCESTSSAAFCSLNNIDIEGILSSQNKSEESVVANASITPSQQESIHSGKTVEENIIKLKSGMEDDGERTNTEDNRPNVAASSRCDTKKKQVRSTTPSSRQRREKTSSLNRCRSASATRTYSKHLTDTTNEQQKYYYSIEKQHDYFLKKEEELRKKQEKLQAYIQEQVNKTSIRTKQLFIQEQDLINAIMEFDTKQELLDKRECDFNEKELIIEEKLHYMTLNEAIVSLNYQELKCDMQYNNQLIQERLRRLEDRERLLEGREKVLRNKELYVNQHIANAVHTSKEEYHTTYFINYLFQYIDRQEEFYTKQCNVKLTTEICNNEKDTIIVQFQGDDATDLNNTTVEYDDYFPEQVEIVNVDSDDDNETLLILDNFKVASCHDLDNQFDTVTKCYYHHQEISKEISDTNNVKDNSIEDRTIHVMELMNYINNQEKIILMNSKDNIINQDIMKHLNELITFTNNQEQKYLVSADAIVASNDSKQQDNNHHHLSIIMTYIMKQQLKYNDSSFIQDIVNYIDTEEDNMIQKSKTKKRKSKKKKSPQASSTCSSLSLPPTRRIRRTYHHPIPRLPFRMKPQFDLSNLGLEFELQQDVNPILSSVKSW